jgi:hypothetical protein
VTKRDEKLAAGEAWLRWQASIDRLFGGTGVAEVHAEYVWMQKLIRALPETVKLTHNPFEEKE